MKQFLIVLAALTAAGSLCAQPQMSKHAADGVACTACHGSDFKAPKAEKCVACHSRDAVAKATEKLNFTAVLKNPKTGKENRHTALVNPHDSYHYGKTQDCLDCHREHKPSTNECAVCHDVKPWGMTVPR